MTQSNEVKSIINCENPGEANIVLMAVPYDETSSFGKGADKGPAAIRGCLDRQIELFHPETNTTPVEELAIAWQRLDMYKTLVTLSDQHEDDVRVTLSPEEMVEAVASAYQENLRRKQFTILLGGEHSVSIGVWKALKLRYKPEEVTILQIDAHFDLRDDDSDFADKPHGRFAHCCVMRRAAELGFRIVSVGIRAYSKEELDYANQMGGSAKNLQVKYFGWPRRSDWLLIGKIMKAISTSNVYITLDVDGLDPSFMPATGTPVQGGLDWYFTHQLLQEIFLSRKVIGADIVEVSPRPNDTLTEYGAAQICYDMIAAHNKNRKRSYFELRNFPAI